MRKLTLFICLTLVSGFAFSQNLCIGGLDLNSVYFTDKNIGYAVGGEWCGDRPSSCQIIIKTIDGGTTWDTLNSGTNTVLNSVFFTDSNTGYAVGENGTIIKTTNGGTNWNTLVSGTTSDLSTVFFVDANIGFVAGSGIILKTIDGGETWDSHELEAHDLNSVFFVNEITGYVVGSNGTIIKTINAGANWINLSSGISYDLNSVFFTDSNIGYAVGGSMGLIRWPTQIIIKTIDGGKTWVTLLNDTNEPLHSVFFTDVNTGYAVGTDFIPFDPYPYKMKILKTNVGGATWTKLEIGTLGALKSIFFTNANSGCAVGENGTILKTTNGGEFSTVVETVSQESTITVYPNPATNKISIATKSNLQGETTICIFNMSGAILQQEKFQSQNLIEMDVRAMAKGIYLLQIQTTAGVETKKLGVQ